jgi:hypothetical protein
MGQRAGGGAVIVVRKIIAVLVMLAAVGGCAAPAQPILTPIEVKVPIATPVYCQVAKLDRPTLPIAALKADSAPADTVRAYAATVAILKGAVQQRDLLLTGCGAPAPGSPAAVTGSGASSGATVGVIK